MRRTGRDVAADALATVAFSLARVAAHYGGAWDYRREVYVWRIGRMVQTVADRFYSASIRILN
jgi:hypothetical protein